MSGGTSQDDQLKRGSGPENMSSLAKQRSFMEIFRVFEALKIPFWLDQGTLLGLVRDGQLLANDHDIDLGMWEEDYRQNRRQIIDMFKLEGAWLETFKPHQLSISALDGRSAMVNIAFYRRSAGKGKMACKKLYYPGTNRLADFLLRVAIFSGYAAGGWLEQLKPGGRLARILIGISKIFPAPLWRFLCYCAGRSQYLFKPAVMMAVPEHFFLNLQQITVDGLVLPVPFNAQAYLALKYGPDWQEPKDEWVFWKDDGAIINKHRLEGN